MQKQQSERSLTFTDHLKHVLEMINKPEMVGQRSPLAAPYFLGAAMRGAETSALGRGKVLCAEIDRALEAMWWGPIPDDGATMLNAALAESDTTGRYDCLILELNYFKRRFRPAPRNQAEIYDDILHISRPTHDRHLRGAVARLGERLLQRLQPAVRPEQPLAPPTLIGRDQLLGQVLADLQAGKMVSLTGPGGIGKSSLGAALVDQWHSPATFWYTLRPTLNDQVESLLFALGHFLHTHGASTLWHQLVADGGRIKDVSLALGLAIADLESLATAPLLCFDELDFLRPLTQEEPKASHTQLLEFLDSLRGHTALLMIGQRGFWQSDATYEIGAWNQTQMASWLDVLGIGHSDEDVALLHDYTAGNPRLAELCVALYESAESSALDARTLGAALEHLPRFHGVLPIWLRLERRLPLAERLLVQSLSVFRSHAPADAWSSASPEQAEALHQLIARRLVQEDGQGGVALLPALREVIYAEMPVEMQETYHAQAAQVRAERGEYTAATYHLQRAGQPEAAIDLWYPQSEYEIQRGQAGAALSLFSQISLRHLDARHRKTLILLRSELLQLMGEPARVVAEIEQSDWPSDDPATPEAKLRLGQALEAQGQPASALETYQAGLEAVTRLLRQGAQLHEQRSFTHLRQREMQQAWQEANLARFHAETMLGVVQDERGDYDTAHQHYLTALRVAEECSYQAGIAQTHHYLAMLVGRRQGIEQALPHFEQAMNFYEQVGDRVNREYVRGNLASAYIQARHFAAALEPAELAMRFFEAMGNPFRTAQNASNLAEAHAELGNLDQAQRFAELVLQQEEPHSHPYALYTLGTVYKLRGDWAQSERHYLQSRQIAEMNDDAYLLAFAWRALGETYQAQACDTAARHAFDQALTLFMQLDIAEEIRQTEALMQPLNASTQCDTAIIAT
jgi:tetratricopeptide (TPR) repeat protein